MMLRRSDTNSINMQVGFKDNSKLNWKLDVMVQEEYSLLGKQKN